MGFIVNEPFPVQKNSTATFSGIFFSINRKLRTEKDPQDSSKTRVFSRVIVNLTVDDYRNNVNPSDIFDFSVSLENPNVNLFDAMYTALKLDSRFSGYTFTDIDP